MSYNTLVHCTQGGATVTVESGGVVELKSGGTLEVESGGIINVLTGGIIKANGTQAAHIADATADAGACATAINAILVVLENAGLTATS